MDSGVRVRIPYLCLYFLSLLFCDIWIGCVVVNDW